MSNNEYSRNLTTGIITHVEGESLVIGRPAHLDVSTLVNELRKLYSYKLQCCII